MICLCQSSATDTSKTHESDMGGRKVAILLDYVLTVPLLRFATLSTVSSGSNALVS